jgi:oxygen-independent coproporphyrinogen-3 oxidase
MGLKNDLMAALVNEIALNFEQFPGIINSCIDTIYFGGGTPSLVQPAELDLLIKTLQRFYTLSPDAEITIEANPDDINPGILKQWKQLGINRLSIGIQSFDEEELRWMNRAHTATASLQCIEDVFAAGFSNFSIDLIYGSPLLTNENWKSNMEILTAKKIPHISSYALTVEPNTALFKHISTQKKQPVDPAKQAEQFILLMEWMQQYGYEHYEISNFSLPGMRSKHNSSYWQGKNYVGIGPSAHSFDGSSRRWNIANNVLYIKAIQQNQIPFEEEILTATQQLNEYIMTSLRTMEGLNLQYVAENFGAAKANLIRQNILKWEKMEKVFEEKYHFVLKREGKLFADGIAADLFFTD